MQRLLLSLSLVSLTIAGRSQAQDPARDFLPPVPPARAIERPADRAVERAAERAVERQEASLSDLPTASITPEMWFYLEEQKRHDDPRQAVRRKAEQKAAERSARLAAMKWYGYSNLRPQASATPWMGTYSPYWAGNSWDPYQHVGVGWPGTALRVEHYEYRR